MSGILLTHTGSFRTRRYHYGYINSHQSVLRRHSNFSVYRKWFQLKRSQSYLTRPSAAQRSRQFYIWGWRSEDYDVQIKRVGLRFKFCSLIEHNSFNWILLVLAVIMTSQRLVKYSFDENSVAWSIHIVPLPLPRLPCDDSSL